MNRKDIEYNGYFIKIVAGVNIVYAHIYLGNEKVATKKGGHAGIATSRAKIQIDEIIKLGKELSKLINPNP